MGAGKRSRESVALEGASKMRQTPVVEVLAQGAWNGGTLVDNSVFENRGMFFKNNRPVNNETIEERVGVRTRVVAPEGERIGTAAMRDLLERSRIDPARIKVVIGATNVGEDKADPGPHVRHAYSLIEGACRDALVLDLYAGCPGFNVAVEMIRMLSMSGVLKDGDISVVVGAENLHRAKAFRDTDTACVIFGDDALATALQTHGTATPEGRYACSPRAAAPPREDFIKGIAEKILDLTRGERIDGILLDNRLGKLQYRIPATAARIQHALVEMSHPGEVSKGTFTRFKDAMEFYDQKVRSFAFDMMSSDGDGRSVKRIARAYVESGQHEKVVSVRVFSDCSAEVMLHRGEGFVPSRPPHGFVDSLTRTHGCFAGYIEALPDRNDTFLEMDGKGVFLHATRGARSHLRELLGRNNLTMQGLDLLIAHQANFAMLPMTLDKVLEDGQPDLKADVTAYLADKMITNIHERGNCSVVCMQRLPYDLERGVLRPNTVQGYPVNRDLERLRKARTIVYDSVGSGMTRSSLLRIVQ